jgi:hypothetical protein
MTNSGVDDPRVRGAARRRYRALAAVAAAAAVLAAGCASAPATPAVASVPAGSTTTPAAGRDPLAFARCMRAHGLPDFPDPDTGGGSHDKGGGKAGPVDVHSPAFQRAEKQCSQYLGGGPALSRNESGVWSLDDKLKYAACMRRNGVPEFKDPDRNGAFPPLRNGLGPQSPQFQKADKACAAYKPQGAAAAPGGPGGGS